MGANDETRFLRTKPRQARSEETVAKLLAAAGEIFGEVGVGAATTTEIAKRAEVAVGSMYHFFPSKGEMALALATQYVDEMVEALTAVAAGFTGVADIEVFTRQMVETTHEVFASHPGYYAALRFSDPTDPAPAPIDHLRTEVGRIIDGLFDKANLNPDNRVAYFTIDIVRLMLEQAPTDKAELDPYLSELVRVIVAYLKAVTAESE